MSQRVASSRRATKRARRKGAKPSRVTTGARKPPPVELQKQLSDALQQQTASSEALRIISSSPGELAPVFQAILKHAIRICEAKFGHLILMDGNRFWVAAEANMPEELAEFFRRQGPFVPTPGSHLDRVRKTKRVSFTKDGTAEAVRGATSRYGGARSIVAVPMLKNDALVGAILIYRQEVRPFAEKQIELLQTLADQAVIAIENARLFEEVQAKTRDLEEAMVHLTGSANILSVIASSPTDIAPVLQAIAKSACEFCDAADAAVLLKEGTRLRFRAHHGSIPVPMDARPINRDWVNGRAVIDKVPIHVHDFFSAEGDDFPQGREMAIRRMVRTILSVPLLHENEAIGTIALRRIEAHPFSDKQIALMRTFANQAAIAIQNVKLFDQVQAKSRDLEESLQQQTATSDVLKVISSSPGDLAPVFESMLANATRICGANFGTMHLYEDGSFHPVAHYNVPSAYPASLAQTPFKPHPQSGLGTVARTHQLVHIEDIRTLPPYLEGDPSVVKIADLAGARTYFVVPMLKENDLIGAITIYRQEVKPFTAKQTELVANFAKQAVIAIENVRLITETREALERQTATAEVLQVINSSPGDLAPVFQAMLEKAHSLCGVSHGSLQLYDGEKFRAVAVHGISEAFANRLRQGYVPGPNHSSQSLLKGARFAQVPDCAGADDQLVRAAFELAGFRTVLFIPLRKDGSLLGQIAAARREVRPFTEKEIALLENFAAQAVIAMENARLLTEQREALERQTATADVLQAINSSPGDLAPVFEMILEKAHSLCAVALGTLLLHDGEKFRAVAVRGFPETFAARLRQGFVPGPNLPHHRLLEGARFAQVMDWAEIDDPIARASLDAGVRTSLFIPLRREGALLGYIAASRAEVRPFTEKEVALLESFAAQAVIAMENARLLGELHERTADLARSVDELTATGDVLKIISRSTTDLETVLDTLVETVARLCRADQALIFRRRDDLNHLAAAHGVSGEARQFMLANPLPSDRGTLSGRVGLERRVVHIPDVMQDEEYTYWEAQKKQGQRTMLGVPLLRGDSLIGIFSITRTRVDPFTPKEIELATTFADQAVIAIENARLFEELRERQAELRVTFDNMGDGVVMFDSELRLTAWNRNFRQILDLPETFLAERPSYIEFFQYLAKRGEYSADLEAELGRRLHETDRESRIERTRPDGRVIEARRNPVPGGGFVLIYADITERKRAEEAVRAARDAAETALRDLQVAQDRLIQTEKLASLGQLTAGIAHEIKNPLNFVNNFSALSVELVNEMNDVLELAKLDDKNREELDEIRDLLKGNLEKVVQHGKRADSIVKNMLLHSRSGSGEHRAVEINAVIEESLNLAYHGARAEGRDFNITLERDFDSAVGVADIYPQEITRVLLNLISNGFYAATKRAFAASDGFEPKLKAVTRNLGEKVEIRIRDNGTGIPLEIREKIFNPFFTTKPAGEGTGLGLSMSHDIVVKQHGGTIDVVTEPGSFTEFIITLPRNIPAGAEAGGRDEHLYSRGR
jgi:PAS domain S-box-containing protein